MRIREDLDVAFVSAKGPVRPENQDDILLYEPLEDLVLESRGRLFALADGMGGLLGGAEASRAALRGFLAGFLAAMDEAESQGTNRPDLAPALRHAFGCASKAVAEEARRKPQFADMGTTLTAFVLRGSEVVGIHIGDSRCLLLSENGDRWLSKLHTTPGQDHILTRALGVGGQKEVADDFSVELHTGDSLLLMSDGFWNSVSIEEIRTSVLGVGAEEATQELVQLALGRDGQDNASLLAVTRLCETRRDLSSREIEETEVSAPPWEGVTSTLPGLLERRWPLLLALIGILFLLIALWIQGLGSGLDIR